MINITPMQIKVLRMQGDLCKLSGAFDDGKMLFDAADTIEAYVKAFEDIREDLKYEIDFCKGSKYTVSAFESALNIIDKYDPTKIEKGDI